ncbi:MAG: hypothetical protein ACLUKN_17445 [Bacilli bacterium]
MTDFTFDSNGSTIIFNKYLKSSNNANMYVANNTRMKICNFNMDWNWDQNPLASIVEVVGLNKSGTNYVDFKFIEYDYFPMRDVRVATLSRYDPETQSVGVEADTQSLMKCMSGKTYRQSNGFPTMCCASMWTRRPMKSGTF